MSNLESTPLDRVKTAFQAYCTVVTRTNERQNYWNSTTKELIYSTLNLLSVDLKPMQALNENSVRNFDTVCLGFGPVPTNIVIHKAAIKGLVKMGGYLFYSQVFNGKVLVGVSYPYVEELQDPTPNKGFAILDPEEVTKEKIFEHVEHFLKELTEVERSPSMEEELKKRCKIGFGHQKDD